MSPTTEAALTVALDRVRWGLAYPRRHAQDDWDGRLRRALAALQVAWRAHSARVEPLLDTLADPTELPFTATDRRVAILRREHRELGKEAGRLCQALRRTPLAYESCFDARQSGQARRRLATLFQRVQALWSGISRHMAAEGTWNAKAPGTAP
jgi:hypothetical protein